MARPRNIRFYDVPLHGKLPEKHDWLQEYHDNSRILVEYMERNGAGSTAYRVTIRCLTLFREYLLESDIPYSPERADQWFDSTGPHPKGYRATLLRLADLFTYKKIQSVNSFPMVLPYSQKLDRFWKSQLTDYLDTLEVSERSVNRIKICIARFLYRIQEQGIIRPEEISFSFLEEYLRSDGHCSSASRSMYTYAISDILLFMADKGLCQHGLGWYPYFRMHDRVFHIRDFSKDQITSLIQLKQASLDFPSEKLALLIQGFLRDFKSVGYSESPCKTASYTLHNLLLFIEMHGFGYHAGIAEIWLEHKKTFHKDTGWKQTRRILRLFDLYTKEGRFVYRSFFREKPLLCDSLPAWCKEGLDEYMTLKIKEGWEKSTLDMIRSSVTRFCIYLTDQGLSSFSGITPGILKDFNLSDRHSSAEGKNAYNSRIRKFIRFLERKEIIPYGFHQGLPGTSAAKEKIVVVLTEDEKDMINEKHKRCTSPIELRDKAMMMLGMKMGLRSIDIVTIRLSDIDWGRQTLRVVQKKTDHEILLPLPTDVGNAIYLYVRDGRPNGKTSSDHLFLKARIPYGPLNRSSCNRALARTLPDRDVPGSSFHVTRKTYATDRLRNGIGKQGIADLLGQKATSSLHHYLQFDEERMRMCPFSLAEAGLLMEGGRYDRI